MREPIRFESRELKPYAEPVSPEALRQGETYFAFLFLDEDGLVPVLEPKVFVGRNLQPGDVDQLYFQDFVSYRRGVRFDTDANTGDESVFEVGAEKHIFEYERALDLLLRCSLKRRQAL
jgi:hypothetical protein